MGETCILYDFDGTVADTSAGVIHCVQTVLSAFGIVLSEDVDRMSFIGPPLNTSLVETCGLSRTDVDEAIKLYHAEYERTGIHMCHSYDGIADLLSFTHELGFTVAMATTKSQVHSRILLNNLGLLNAFDFIAGANGTTRIHKQQVIEYALHNLGITPDRAIMIGDRMYDVEGAHAFGMKCAYVLWGFGNRAEATECGAEFVCEDMNDIKALLKKIRE